MSSTIEDKKEIKFRAGMNFLAQIESEINSLNSDYSEGQLAMGLACFQKEDLHHLLTPKSFGVGCASLKVRQDKGTKMLSLIDIPKEELKFIVSEADMSGLPNKTLSKNSEYCIQNDDFDQEYYKEEQEKLEKQFKLNGNDPLNQIGIHFPSSNILNAQTHMRKTLTAAINIANLLQNLRDVK